VCVEKGRVKLFDGVFGSVLEKLVNIKQGQRPPMVTSGYLNLRMIGPN